MVFEISGVFDCSDYCGEISLSRNRIKVKRRTDMLQLHGRKKGIWIAVLTVLIFVWTFVIFAQSAKTGAESTGDTNRLIEWIESLVDSVWPDVEVAAHPLRKLAHFGEYLILGVLSAALIGVLGGNHLGECVTDALVGHHARLLDQLTYHDHVGKCGHSVI